MRFVYADSLDYVDPGYDFLQDRATPGRQHTGTISIPTRFSTSLPTTAFSFRVASWGTAGAANILKHKRCVFVA
jgi:hypothetical protein